MHNDEKTDEPFKLRVGTRQSALAMVQTEFVIEKLKEIYPEINVIIKPMSTKGDMVLDRALSKIGDKGLFTKELENALEANDVDLVVHSLKDLPSNLPNNMVIGAILRRVDPRDVVILGKNIEAKATDVLSNLPEGSILGTSSVRRTAQLRGKYSHLKFCDIRGNLNTRLRKLDEENSTFSAIVLAAAGVQRMGWENRISMYLDNETCLHAVGQGAIAIECLKTDLETLRLIGRLSDHASELECLAERSFMRRLEGGCSMPVAAHAFLNKSGFSIEGMVSTLDGSNILRMNCFSENPQLNAFDAEQVGLQLANMMIEAGASDILKDR